METKLKMKWNFKRVLGLMAGIVCVAFSACLTSLQVFVAIGLMLISTMIFEIVWEDGMTWVGVKGKK